eukprot:TRINITY_DN16323_c0_g1_i1.p1 TRINITY_DN16323_c0_g1~~TRINITY_DN16323_c0_g1_i1.p1  ORF type:complete len:141 (+),score=55.12 TRINITY_DN16323_c0_g1_i1:116-538(+)
MSFSANRSGSYAPPLTLAPPASNVKPPPQSLRSSRTHDQLLRDHEQERKRVRDKNAALSTALTATYGCYVGVDSLHGNYVVPALPAHLDKTKRNNNNNNSNSNDNSNNSNSNINSNSNSNSNINNDGGGSGSSMNAMDIG